MDRKVIISTLKEGPLRGWEVPALPIQLESIAWAPDFVSANKVGVLTLGSEIQPFLQKRMRAAKAAGREIHCICTLATLSEPENLALFSELDSSILLYEESACATDFLPLLKALAVEQVAVLPASRSRLVSDGLRRCIDASTASMKGKTLEWLLHFMFSQVSDFRVVRCNYQTTNEELDALVQLRAFNPEYVWAHKAAPFIIVEAKNRKEPQEQEVVSKLNSVIQTKSGNCKIGVIVSLSGFTSGARNQRLKMSMSDITFVMMDSSHLQQWADATDYEGKLDEIVRDAMLP